MANDITFRTDILTKLKASCATDDDVIEAMLVCSDKNIPKMTNKAKFGRINSLMRDRHGTPFEHTFLKFYSEAPIFVYREWHRHRIGVSINEQSGRYSELPPMFYIPPKKRLLVKREGSKQMNYELVPGTPEQYKRLVDRTKRSSTFAYEMYQENLEDGIVKEVARIHLGVNIYSKMIWSCNARSLMAFLSLRTRKDPFLREPLKDDHRGYGLFETHPGGAMFPSKPQWEITVAADAIEAAFKKAMPLTHKAFNLNGRVAP